MRRSLPVALSSITPLLVMALAAGCGHTKKTLDAYDQSKADMQTGENGGAGSEDLLGFTKDSFTCDAAPSQQYDAVAMKSYVVPEEVAAEVESVLSMMTPAQKASQMIGVPVGNRNYRDIERSPDIDVPGVGPIRGYRYRDAGKGVNMDAGQDNRPDNGKNYSTVFPAPSIRAASWDVYLERRVGAAIGDETAASKNNMMLAPCMNIIRHPYWGRTQETYGEDMYHVGRMAAALTVGIQQYVVSCPKHFLGNNIEQKRSTQNARMTEQTLREIYGRHFEMVVQDGAAGCIMNSYNLVNDIKATQNAHLIRNVLKGPVEAGGMGFGGLVLTDWWAMPGDQNVPDSRTAQSVTDEAVIAGTDVEVPWTLHYSEVTLPNVPDQSLVTDAARRVLTQKYLFNTALDEGDTNWGLKPPTSQLSGDSIVPNENHEALAEETEIKSAVLLTNGLDGGPPVLPLTQGNIAVVGPDQEFSLSSSSVPKSCGFDDSGSEQGQTNPNPRACTFHYATDPALGDRGSSRVNGDPTRSIDPFKGIQMVGTGKTVTSGNSAAAAAGAEAVVVVVGYTPGDEGEEYAIREGGDRKSLDLPPGQNAFVASVLDLNKPTVIIIESGSIVNVPWLSHANRNQATIWAGYPGLRGGSALGKLIFGQANFAGKMPLAWPAESELQVFKETETVTNMGYFFGYREYDRRKYRDQLPVNLVFPFGHGLSYSTFEYANVQVPCETVPKDAIVCVTADITNTSEVDGDEVVMLFVKPPARPGGLTGERPWKELKSFARVSVKAGETKEALLPLRVNDLRRWEGGTDGRWVVDSGAYSILVAKDAEAAETTTNTGTLTVNGDG